MAEEQKSYFLDTWLLSITQKGIDLKEKAKPVPIELGKCLEIKEEDGKT